MGSIAIGLWVGACGLEESGLFGNDASVGDAIVENVVLDVPIVDNFVPPPCSDPDASVDAACLGKPVPSGWVPVGVLVDASVACPATFTTEHYVTDPQLAPGACTCSGCNATGAWSCAYTLSAGTTCTQTSIVEDASACWSISHGSIDVTAVRSGAPTCGGGQQTGNLDASSTSVTACVPACASDFCGLANQGYKLCVLNSSVTDGGCPQDFPSAHLAGVSTILGCNSCQACGLANADAGCSAGYATYNSNNCTGTPLGTGNLNASCDSTQNFNSVYLDASNPQPNCGPTNGTTGGSVALVGPLTICCAQ